MTLQKSLLLVLVCMLAITWTMAAEKVELRQNAKLLLQMQQMQTRASLSHQDLLVNGLGMSKDTTLKLVRKIANDRNVSCYRYEVQYRGIPVWGHDIVMVEDMTQRVVNMHGFAVTGIEKDLADVEPAFDAQTAMDLVKSLHVVTEERETVLYENESSTLVIYMNEDKAQLCYAVTFFADVSKGGKPTRPVYFIDAKTKDVVSHFEGLTTEGYADGTGPGGNTKTGKYYYGKDYPAFKVGFANGVSSMENDTVKTVNLNHGYSGNTTYTFTGTENLVKEINGAYSPLNDAHYFGGVVFNVYKDWYNTAPLTFKLTLKVHYANSYENAFWDGSSMTFGDGKSRFFPLVSLDVVTHEVSHGFTEQNSALVYSAQSGGINEAFSDIAGEAAKYYMRGNNDWMVGADIFKSTGALRYFANPPQDGRSIGSAKDYKDGMDVHYSSGVYNKAFYLLCTRSGWNTKKGFDVFVKANQSYWTANATFVTGAQGCRDAAKALGYSVSDVVAAFQGVDVAITAE